MCPRLEQEFEPWRQAAYWKAMHRRALEREAQLQAEIQWLEALVRLREQQLFGRKTETSAATAPAASDASHADSPPRQPRGQQRGQPSPSAAIIPTSLTWSKTRSCRPTSAAARGVVSRSPISRAPRIPPSWRSTSGPIAESFAGAVIDRLARCGPHPWHRHRPATGPADSQEHAGGLALGDAAPLDKYLFYRPTYRLLADWCSHGLYLSLGTLTDGLKADGAAVRAGVRGLGEAEPRAEAVARRRDAVAGLRHARRGGRLPVVSGTFHSREVVIFILAAGRSHDVPEEHLGPVVGPGIMVVDRYKAYQAVDKVWSGLIVLAFCWGPRAVRVSGDARSWPDQEAWAMGWMERSANFTTRWSTSRGGDDAAAFATANGAFARL